VCEILGWRQSMLSAPNIKPSRYVLSPAAIDHAHCQFPSSPTSIHPSISDIIHRLQEKFKPHESIYHSHCLPDLFLKPYVQSSFVLLVDFYTGMVYPETIM
jgi:hypothetical protein